MGTQETSDTGLDEVKRGKYTTSSGRKAILSYKTGKLWKGHIDGEFSLWMREVIAGM